MQVLKSFFLIGVVTNTRRRTDQPLAIPNINVRQPRKSPLDSMFPGMNIQGQGGARLQKFQIPELNTFKSGLTNDDLPEDPNQLIAHFSSNQMFYPASHKSENESEIMEVDEEDKSADSD